MESLAIFLIYVGALSILCLTAAAIGWTARKLGMI
jgi:hypothetical protein